jgi:hypothetical protein
MDYGTGMVRVDSVGAGDPRTRSQAQRESFRHGVGVVTHAATLPAQRLNAPPAWPNSSRYTR